MLLKVVLKINLIANWLQVKTSNSVWSNYEELLKMFAKETLFDFRVFAKKGNSERSNAKQ